MKWSFFHFLKVYFCCFCVCNFFHTSVISNIFVPCYIHTDLTDLMTPPLTHKDPPLKLGGGPYGVVFPNWQFFWFPNRQYNPNSRYECSCDLFTAANYLLFVTVFMKEKILPFCNFRGGSL